MDAKPNIERVIISDIKHYDFDAKDFPRYRVALKFKGFDRLSISGEFAVQVAPGGIAMMRYNQDHLFNPQVWNIEQGSRNDPSFRDTFFRYGPLVSALTIQDHELELDRRPPVIVNETERDLRADLQFLLKGRRVEQELPDLRALGLRERGPNIHENTERIFGRRAALDVINGFPANGEHFGWALKYHPNARLDKIPGIELYTV